MKLAFPYTPTMRYERMLAAIVLALMCFVLAAQLGDMALQISGELPAVTLAAAHRQTLSMVAFAFAASSLGLVGLAFVIFAAIKINFFQGTHGRQLYFGIRRFGLGLVRFGLVFAALWLLAQVLLLS